MLQDCKLQHGTCEKQSFSQLVYDTMILFYCSTAALKDAANDGIS